MPCDHNRADKTYCDWTTSLWSLVAWTNNERWLKTALWFQLPLLFVQNHCCTFSVLRLKWTFFSGENSTQYHFSAQEGRKDEIGGEGIETVFAPPEPWPGLTLHQPTLDPACLQFLSCVLCFVFSIRLTWALAKYSITSASLLLIKHCLFPLQVQTFLFRQYILHYCCMAN